MRTLSRTFARGRAQRYVPGTPGGALKVPLWTALAKGQMFEGKIEIPARLAHSQPDTNARHEFERIVREHIHRWVEWRDARGWVIASFPKVRGPYDPPTPSERDEVDSSLKWYFVQARFTRKTPLYVGIDDFLHERDKAATYGVDIEADWLPWDVGDGGDSGWINPLEHAAQRRARLGLKRRDFLLGPLSAPRTPPPGVGVNPIV